MAVAVDPTQLFQTENMSRSGDTVYLKCRCSHHVNSHDDTYDMWFNVVTLEQGSWGSCRSNHKGENFRHLLIWLQTKWGIDPVVERIPIEDIAVRKSNDYDWSQLLAIPLAIDDDYLGSRGVGNDLVKQYALKSDEEKIVMPNVNFNGEVVGVNIRYKPASKRKVRYMYYGERTPLFMMNDINRFDAKKPLVIVEGSFGMLRLASHGVQAIALLGSGGMKFAKHLERFEQLYVMADKDSAGRNYVRKLLRHKEGLMIKALEPCESDELSKTELERILKGSKHSFYSLWEREWFNEH